MTENWCDVNKSATFKCDCDIATATGACAKIGDRHHPFLLTATLPLRTLEAQAAVLDGKSYLLNIRLCPRESRKVNSSIQYQTSHLPVDYRHICALRSTILLDCRVLHLLLVIYTICRHRKGCSSTIQVLKYLD